MFDFSQIRIDRESVEPLHMQLARELRRSIREINQEDYEALPSERTLCGLLDLNRVTVHKAYEALENSGIVRRQPNKSLIPVRSARKRLEGNLPAIGIVLPCRFSQYIAGRKHTLKLLEGIFDRAAERQYAVFMQELPSPKTAPAERKNFISTHFSGLTGVLLLGDRDYDRDFMFDELLNYSGIPQVAIAGEVHELHIGAVKCSFEKAASDMADFFRSQGVRSVGTVACSSSLFVRDSKFDYSARHRDATMRKIIQSQGFELPEKWQINADFTEAELVGDLPDAFWCYNDDCAMSLQNTLTSLGVAPMPLICGFDGILPDAEFATICQPYLEIGAQAVDLLIEQFENGITQDNRIRYLDAMFVLPKSMKDFVVPKKRGRKPKIL